MCTTNIALTPGSAKRTYLVARRDHLEANEKGVVLLEDYVEVPGDRVILEITDGDIKPIALRKSSVGFDEALKEVSRLRKLFSSPRLFRTRDLIGTNGVAKLLNRDKSTVAGKYVKRDDFPKPYGKFGQSFVYDKREIEKWWRHVYKERKW